VGGIVAGVKGQVQARGVARRAAILEAATEVFALHGYRGGSLALIGERVGLTPAGVLRHFGTKEALLLAVIDERGRRAAVVAEELAGLPGLDAVRGFVRYAELTESEAGIAALFTILQAEHLEVAGAVRDYFLDRNRTLRRAIAASLRRGQRDGTIRSGIDRSRIADEVMAFMEGAALTWLLDRDLSLVGLYRTYLDRLADDIAT
jgi:AcrR family transcriptional regulator